MKKYRILLITVIFLTSCHSKRKLVSNPNYKKPVQKEIKKKYLKGKLETNKIPKDKIKTGTNESIVENEIKNNTSNLSLNDRLLNDLLFRKPNLMQEKIAYIRKFSHLAINEMNTYAIPASITLAQGLLESQYGQSELTRKSKNHFGIKCHKWIGKRVYHDDDAKGECFRKYDLDKTSYRDHSLFLAKRKRYSELFTFRKDDYKSWAKGLRKAGYATDKKYPEKLIKLIEDYELYRFDEHVLMNGYIPINTAPTSVINDYPLVHVVLPGDTLDIISAKYNIPIINLMQFNHLNSTVLEIGKELKLEGGLKKHKNRRLNSTIKNSYIVKPGDTIYAIAKKHKTSVKKIKYINKLTSNKISIGQILIIN